MKGSEKQVAWAEQIKANAIGTCDANIDRLNKMLKEYPGFGHTAEELQKFETLKAHLIAKFDTVDNAKWYIDNRDRLSGAHVLTMVEKKLYWFDI